MTHQSYQEIPLVDLHPNTHNPRSIRVKGQKASIEDLVPSIKALGILQPLVVAKHGDGYTILAGERRFKAAKRAKLETVPCIVREDSQGVAEAITVTENFHRKNLHPLQESEGIARLVEKGSDRKEVASLLGLSESVVTRRLQWRQLHPKLKALYLDSESVVQGWSVRMLELAASYSQEVQASAVEELHDAYGGDAPRTPGQLREWLEYQSHDLSQAPWDLSDGELTDAGPCHGCTSNTATHGQLFEDLEDAEAKCTAPACWDLKRRAFLMQAFEVAKAEHGESLWVYYPNYHFDADTLPAFGQEVLSKHSECEVVEKGTEGAFPALVLASLGDHTLGEIVWLAFPESQTVEEEGAPASEGDSLEAKLERTEELLRRKRFRHAVPALIESAEEAATPSIPKLMRLLGCFGGPARSASRSDSRYGLSNGAKTLAPKVANAWLAFEDPQDEAAMREALWRSVQAVIAERLTVEYTFSDFDLLEQEASAYARLVGLSWETFWEAARVALPPSKALVQRRVAALH